MSRTISANEFNGQLSEIMDWVREHNDVVIIERDGEPSVVVIPYPQYEELQQLRREARRQTALADAT